MTYVTLHCIDLVNGFVRYVAEAGDGSHRAGPYDAPIDNDVVNPSLGDFLVMAQNHAVQVGQGYVDKLGQIMDDIKDATGGRITTRLPELPSEPTPS